jgi:hypothetical protein
MTGVFPPRKKRMSENAAASAREENRCLWTAENSCSCKMVASCFMPAGRLASATCRRRGSVCDLGIGPKDYGQAATSRSL